MPAAPKDAEPAPAEPAEVALLDRQQAPFGYTQEDVKLLLTPMAESGEEALGSMGNDARSRCCPTVPKVFYNYFKQLFAGRSRIRRSIRCREEIVMSLVSSSARPNLLAVDYESGCHQAADAPRGAAAVLTPSNMEKIRHVELFSSGAFRSVELDICYPRSGRERHGGRARRACRAREDAIRQGYNILILSDRPRVAVGAAHPGAAAPTGGRCTSTSAEGAAHLDGARGRDGRARGPSTSALLAVTAPRRSSLSGRWKRWRNCPNRFRRSIPGESGQAFHQGHLKALNKVMSKLGISTTSPTAARRSSRPGPAEGVVDKYFTGTASNVEGIGLFESWPRTSARPPRAAFGDDPLRCATCSTPAANTSSRIRGEAHMWTPESICKPSMAARSGSVATYRDYAKLINDQAAS